MAESLPTWERGLKFSHIVISLADALVAPYMGAWIEISIVGIAKHPPEVAPYMGAWIEILL